MRNIPYDAPGLQPRRPSPFALPPFALPPFTASRRRPPPSRCRPLSYPLSASLSQPRCPPPPMLAPTMPCDAQISRMPFVARSARSGTPRRFPAARLRPVAVHYLISVRFPITAPPPPPFVPRLSPRPAAARLRPVAAHYLISVRFPITAPLPAAPMLAPTMPCDAQIPRMPFVARSVRSGTPRRFPAALLSPHPSLAKFPCHLAAAGGIVV